MSSELELVDFHNSLVCSLDSVGAGGSGFDSDMASVFSSSLTSVTAGWLFIVMSWVNMMITSSGEYDGLRWVGILCIMVDGLVRLLLYLIWNVGLLR